MKYIDAEKLIAEVKKLNLVTKTYEEQVAFNNALAMVVDIINSLQPEQPDIDWEKEIDKMCCKCTKSVSSFDWDRFARHFYELGKKGGNK